MSCCQRSGERVSLKALQDMTVKTKLGNIYEPILLRTLDRVRPDTEIIRGVSLAALRIMPVQMANMTLLSQLRHGAPYMHVLTYTLYPPY